MSILVTMLSMAVSIPMLVAILLWSALSFTDLQVSNYDKKKMENWNYFKWLAYGVSMTFTSLVSVATWRPKSSIDKEIAEEKKEIAELERQKEKMEKLEELKRRREKLFNDVHGERSWECTSCGDEFETLLDYGKHISEVHHS